jgi:HAMP domain-containing protein
MAALGGGLVALLLGIIGIITWWGYFAKALLAAIPAMLILGGALAAYLGFEELKDKKETPVEPFDETNSLKGEINTLKEELSKLKNEKE